MFANSPSAILYPRCAYDFIRPSMITAAKPVSIQKLVEGLRQMPDSAFGPD